MFSRGGGGGGGEFGPLQISAAEGPISMMKIGTDIEKHVKSVAACFFPPKTLF